MHTCPECGQACTCNGDIDDCLDICEDDADNCIHDCGFSDDDDGFVCCYQGECCMPGIHLLSECHTAADVEAQYEETPNVELRGATPHGGASARTQGSTAPEPSSGD